MEQRDWRVLDCSARLIERLFRDGAARRGVDDFFQRAEALQTVE